MKKYSISSLVINCIFRACKIRAHALGGQKWPRSCQPRPLADWELSPRPLSGRNSWSACRACQIWLGMPGMPISQVGMPGMLGMPIWSFSRSSSSSPTHCQNVWLFSWKDYCYFCLFSGKDKGHHLVLERKINTKQAAFLCRSWS